MASPTSVMWAPLSTKPAVSELNYNSGSLAGPGRFGGEMAGEDGEINFADLCRGPFPRTFSVDLVVAATVFLTLLNC
jgi:hypothetical protein